MGKKVSAFSLRVSVCRLTPPDYRSFGPAPRKKNAETSGKKLRPE